MVTRINSIKNNTNMTRKLCNMWADFTRACQVLQSFVNIQFLGECQRRFVLQCKTIEGNWLNTTKNRNIHGLAQQNKANKQSNKQNKWEGNLEWILENDTDGSRNRDLCVGRPGVGRRHWTSKKNTSWSCRVGLLNVNKGSHTTTDRHS